MNTLNELNLILSRNQKRKLFLLSFLLLIGMFFEMMGLGILVPTLSLMLNNSLSSKYAFINDISLFLGSPSKQLLCIYGMIFISAFYFIKTIYLIFLSWFQSRYSSNLAAEIGNKLYAGYLNQPYPFHLNRNSAELIRNIQTEVTQFAAVSQSTIILATELAVIIGLSIMIIAFEPFGAILVITFLTTLAYLFHLLTRKKILEWGKLRQIHSKFLNQHLMQGLGGIKDVKIFNKELHFSEQYNSHNFQFAKIQTRVTTFSLVPRLYLELLAVFGLSFFVILNVIQGKSLVSIIPVLGIFVTAAFRMMPSVNRIMGSMQQIRFSKPVINLLHEEFLKIKKPIDFNNFEKTKITFLSSILIKNVFFSYKNKPILSNINLRINKGDTIGIIGGSGAGKSTLIDLILGLLRPNEGNIFVDNNDINCNIQQWQSKIGYVPQFIYLTDDSLKNNIAFGIPENEINEDSLKIALKSAQLDEFILELPEGIETRVGERGVRISGGQRQRIGIARALYNNPEILVLDEATSSLDLEIEKEVMSSVYNLKGKKTIVIIAHRLSTLESCNKVYKVQLGKVLLIND